MEERNLKKITRKGNKDITVLARGGICGGCK